MSQDDTGSRQRARCRELGLEVTELPVLHDVDEIADARRVAAAAPATRFARTLAGLGLDAPPPGS